MQAPNSQENPSSYPRGGDFHPERCGPHVKWASVRKTCGPCDRYDPEGGGAVLHSE